MAAGQHRDLKHHQHTAASTGSSQGHRSIDRMASRPAAAQLESAGVDAARPVQGDPRADLEPAARTLPRA